ncbi:MAG TPA: YihA family ribosome biogenesis GTP-binding protein [Desulfobacteraceae bacterium]|nr:YihA family ribosome biogenesis GTP-binding protein [Desulfobacteraceae bacterium]
MKIKTAQFVKSAVKPSQYPPGVIPEIAFTGRSNAGKSSLINILVNQKQLVKTSRTPGRTQLINFFLINNQFMFVDLPGYGYAKVPPKIKKKWGPMIETYLSGRKILKGVILIMDIRRIPGRQEQNFIGWLDYFNIPAILVLTKSDKLSKTKQIRQRYTIAKFLSVEIDKLILFSAKSRHGKEDILDAVERLVSPEEPEEAV